MQKPSHRHQHRTPPPTYPPNTQPTPSPRSPPRPAPPPAPPAPQTGSWPPCAPLAGKQEQQPEVAPVEEGARDHAARHQRAPWTAPIQEMAVMFPWARRFSASLQVLAGRGSKTVAVFAMIELGGRCQVPTRFQGSHCRRRSPTRLRLRRYHYTIPHHALHPPPSLL